MSQLKSALQLEGGRGRYLNHLVKRGLVDKTPRGYVVARQVPPYAPEQEIIKEVRKRYSELEDLWDEAEKDLRRFRVYRPVKHSYNGRNMIPDDPDSPYGCEYLSWRRYGKAWRICHGTYFDESPPEENSDWTPVVDCPVDVRVEAIAQFQGLREAVIKAAEASVPELDKAICKFRNVLKG
jgi:hypothetical protein